MRYVCANTTVLASTSRALPGCWVLRSAPHRHLLLHSQLCLTLCDRMDGSPPDSSVRPISQARILEWVAGGIEGIFPTQGLNLCLLCWQVGSLLLSHQGSLSQVRVPVILRSNPVSSDSASVGPAQLNGWSCKRTVSSQTEDPSCDWVVAWFFVSPPSSLPNRNVEHRTPYARAGWRPGQDKGKASGKPGCSACTCGPREQAPSKMPHTGASFANQSQLWLGNWSDWCVWHVCV